MVFVPASEDARDKQKTASREKETNNLFVADKDEEEAKIKISQEDGQTHEKGDCGTLLLFLYLTLGTKKNGGFLKPFF